MRLNETVRSEAENGGGSTLSGRPGEGSATFRNWLRGKIGVRCKPVDKWREMLCCRLKSYGRECCERSR